LLFANVSKCSLQ